MIKNILSEIKKKIESSKTIGKKNKGELLDLVETLRDEVQALSQTHTNQAKSITGFTEITAHEATREDKNSPLLELSLQGLEKSVEGFEQTHPKLVKIVNALCSQLSDLGI